MGGKRELVETDYAKISAMAAKGAREVDIARHLGMAYETWQRLKSENPRVIEFYEAGRSFIHDQLVGKLIAEAMDGNTASLLFALKSMFGYTEYGSHSDQEARVKITFELPASLSPDAYGQVIEAERLQIAHKHGNGQPPPPAKPKRGRPGKKARQR